MKKKLLISFGIVLGIFICAELLSNLLYQKLPDAIVTVPKSENSLFLAYKLIKPFNPKEIFNYNDNDYRFFRGNNDKKPIAVVGCSCTTGIGLKREETFAAQLNKLTGRTVYSRVNNGSFTNYVYYQFLQELIPKNSEYIIYFYLPHHPLQPYFSSGLNGSCITALLYRINKKGELEQIKQLPFIHSLYVVQIADYFKMKKFAEKEGKIREIQAMMFKTIVKKLKTSYSKSKFVIIKFQVDENEDMFFPDDLEKYLLDNGVIILDAEKLTGEKYYLPENKLEVEQMHPSAKVWEKFTPALVKKLNL